MNGQDLTALEDLWWWSGFYAGVSPAIIVGFLLGRWGRPKPSKESCSEQQRGDVRLRLVRGGPQ